MARTWARRDVEHDVRHQSRGERSAGGDVRLQCAEDDVWRQAHQLRRYDLRLRERERRWARSHRPRPRDLGHPDPKETWDRATSTAREHYHQTRGACEAAPGAERAQTVFRLERRPARDRAQLQILPSGNEQDRRYLG